MRGWQRVRAASLLVALVYVCCVGVSAGPLQAGDEIGASYLLFSGSDLWRDGAFAYGGLLWSPQGLDRPGFTLKALISGGLYDYRAGDLGNARVDGTEFSGQMLPGWRFKHERFEVTVFLGPELQRNRLRPNDPGNAQRGSKLGARFAIELWDQPTASTMLAANASVSSINTDYCARLAYGWRLFNRFYAGPETQIYGAVGYRQLRFGVHVTGLKVGTGQWSLAGGWAFVSDERSGPYLRLGFMERR
jgi:hypothetical protein